MTTTPEPFTVVEVCSGAGGLALGLETAGFTHTVCVDSDAAAAATIRGNRPEWAMTETDLRDWEPTPDCHHPDVFAGGVPCPPFSRAGKQAGHHDERNLFDHALTLINELNPRMVLLENVPGLMERKFTPYRDHINTTLHDWGYHPQWRIMEAAAHRVPQNRFRAILIATHTQHAPGRFTWPEPASERVTVGETLHDLVAANGWEGATAWAEQADTPAPTVVGGSKNHGGPDLGPSRSRAAWARLGVWGSSVADQAPAPDHTGPVRLTLRMLARIQGFPDTWQFAGTKTDQFRQIGNAVPPPLGAALGLAIRAHLTNPEPVLPHTHPTVPHPPLTPTQPPTPSIGPLMLGDTLGDRLGTVPAREQAGHWG